MSAYTNETKVEAYLDRALTANELTLLEEVIEYISSVINGYTNRQWVDIAGEEPEESTKLYDGNGNKEIFIDDFSSISSIELLDSQGSVYVEITDEADFITYPLNASVFQSVYLRNYIAGRGAGRVRITGVFSSGNVPADIKMVATALVSKFINRSTTNSGTFKKESIEGYSYEVFSGKDSDEETQSLLNTLAKWRKITF